MTPDEAVALAERMRAAGVMKFRLRGDSLYCELRPADPKPMTEIVDRIAEMDPLQRKKLLDEAKKDLERDLYGAVT